MNRTLTGSIFVVASAVGYAFLPIFARLAYRTDVTAFEVLTWRFVIAAGIIWALFPVWGKRANLGSLQRRDVLILGAMGVLFSGAAYTAFWGLTRLPAPVFTMLYSVYPAVTALLSTILGERLPLPAWLAVGLAVCGAALTGLARKPTAAGYNLLDMGIPLLAAAIYSVYLVLAQRYTRNTSGLASAVVSITGSLLVLLLISPVVGLRVPTETATWLPIAGIAIFSTVFTVLAMFEGIARIGAARAAILGTVEPVTVVLLAVVILGEKAQQIQYIGGALILASVVLLNLPIGRPPTEAQLEQPQ